MDAVAAALVAQSPAANILAPVLTLAPVPADGAAPEEQDKSDEEHDPAME